MGGKLYFFGNGWKISASAGSLVNQPKMGNAKLEAKQQIVAANCQQFTCLKVEIEPNIEASFATAHTLASLGGVSPGNLLQWHTFSLYSAIVRPSTKKLFFDNEII